MDWNHLSHKKVEGGFLWREISRRLKTESWVINFPEMFQFYFNFHSLITYAPALCYNLTGLTLGHLSGFV